MKTTELLPHMLTIPMVSPQPSSVRCCMTGREILRETGWVALRWQDIDKSQRQVFQIIQNLPYSLVLRFVSSRHSRISLWQDQGGHEGGCVGERLKDASAGGEGRGNAEDNATKQAEKDVGNAEEEDIEGMDSNDENSTRDDTHLKNKNGKLPRIHQLPLSPYSPTYSDLELVLH